MRSIIKLAAASVTAAGLVLTIPTVASAQTTSMSVQAQPSSHHNDPGFISVAACIAGVIGEGVGTIGGVFFHVPQALLFDLIALPLVEQCYHLVPFPNPEVYGHHPTSPSTGPTSPSTGPTPPFYTLGG